MTPGWMTQRLRMGTKTYLSHPLYWQGWEGRKEAAVSQLTNYEPTPFRDVEQ
jgi:hypothetical protein